MTDNTIIINLTDEQVAELKSLAAFEGEDDIERFMAGALLDGLDACRQRRVAQEAIDSGEWDEGPYISAASVRRRRENPGGANDP